MRGSLFGDKEGVCDLTLQGIECGLMIQLF